MSGHSKWSTIKRQKGANDAKRGQLFTKLSNAIMLAVKEGGGISDPNGNPRLRLAIDAARSANMPKENIERAIERALGKTANEVTEVIYEGFGPGGFSVIIEAITDNKQRTTPEIKSIFDKNGGSLGVPGSVSYQFVQKGEISIGKNGRSLDEIFLLAADAGAEDVEEREEEIIVYTTPEKLAQVRDTLQQAGITVLRAELTRRPIVYTPITDPAIIEKIVPFMEKLESLDDVQKVYANYDISETDKKTE
ncbi:MAG: putative transcriptional regulatory protein [Patescibacteria group bacterium]|nr:MAG: putative transcriptional regulatory protein [Patescibacteria group bacterium]